MTLLARVTYALSIGACLLVGAVAAAYVLVQLGPHQLAWWTCGLVPALFAVVALVACFTPYDSPASTPRWVGVLVGAALGGAGLGLLCFPATFLVLSPVGVAYAFALRWSALYLSRARLAEDEIEEVPLTRMRVPAAVGALLAIVSLVAMRPAGEGPRPLAEHDASIAPVLSRPPVELDRNRVRRHDGYMEARGRRVRVLQSLMQPRVQVELRKQTLLVDPCLRVQRGSVDGFLFARELNGYSLELAGMAKASYVEGWARGWLRAEFLRSRVLRGALPGFFGSGPQPDAVSGSVVVVADLEAGWVAIEGTTRVHTWLPAERVVGCRIELKNPASATLNLGLGGGATWELPENENQVSEALIFDADSVRLIRTASRGRVASAVGDDLEWIVLEGPRDPILILTPDWMPTAAHDRVRAGPPDFLSNSLTARRGKDHLALLFDPGSSRFSAAPLSSWVRPGLYRNRIALMPLNPGEGPRNAARDLAHQLRW